MAGGIKIDKQSIIEKLEHYTPGELKRLVADLVARPKVGLYWERDAVARDRALNDDHVFLDYDPALSCGGSPHGNLIIEGDNFDALRLLRTTHAGRIRVILIDPPYNTGNRDFVYNDCYVTKEDRFRQSTWLEWLYQRLRLAHDLLSDDGVILVCISDENRSRLELMMDEVFPGRRVGSFVWKTRSGSNDSAEFGFSSDHEHILIYAKPGFEFTGAAKDFRQYNRDDHDGRGPWKTGDLTQGKNRTERAKAYYPLHNPETGIWYPCNPTRVWAFASEDRLEPGQKTRKPPMEEWIRRRKIVWPEPGLERVVIWNTREELLAAIDSGDVPTANRGRTPLLTRDLPDLDFWIGKPMSFNRPWFKRHLSDVKSAFSVVSSWVRGISEKPEAAHDELEEIVTQRSGTSEDSVKEILGAQVFNYPKPPSLFRELLRFATDRDDIVLDFFAGSGTTAHAVLQLNAEDGGNRRFILVSSTEATDEEPTRNLCRDVCAERVRRVINGYGKVAGLGGEFAYLRAIRLTQGDLPWELTPELAWRTLCLRHGGGIAEMPVEPVAEIPGDGEAQIFFCPSTGEETLALLAERLSGPAIIYSDRPGAIRDAFPSQRALEIRDIKDSVETAAVPPEDEP